MKSEHLQRGRLDLFSRRRKSHKENCRNTSPLLIRESVDSRIVFKLIPFVHVVRFSICAIGSYDKFQWDNIKYPLVKLYLIKETAETE